MKNSARTEKMADALDFPLEAICDIPKMEITGNKEILIENFRGILDYDSNSIKINTRIGIIKIDGDELIISSVTDESVCIKGKIFKTEFI